jgi:hypothetical protein
LVANNPTNQPADTQLGGVLLFALRYSEEHEEHGHPLLAMVFAYMFKASITGAAVVNKWKK